MMFFRGSDGADGHLRQPAEGEAEGRGGAAHGGREPSNVAGTERIQGRVGYQGTTGEKSVLGDVNSSVERIWMNL